MKKTNQTKNRNVVKITKEVKIPGTDIILEKGDKIKIVKEYFGVKEADILVKAILNYVEAVAGSESGEFEVGEMLGTVIGEQALKISQLSHISYFDPSYDISYEPESVIRGLIESLKMYL